MTDLIIALIGSAGSVFVGVLSFLGVVITNSKNNQKLEQKMEIFSAVTETRITELTREVREHNHFASRIPVVENDIKTIYHRLNSNNVNQKNN